MVNRALQIPPGPPAECQTSDDLLHWMGQQFGKFGDTYRASLFGTNVYITRDPEFAHHVLVENWQNYVKGQFIKRVAVLLGNGLMVSEGEVWKRQRRMIQPAFHAEAIASMTKLIVAVNTALLKKWLEAARTSAAVNVTRDVSGMALEVVLRSIFGRNYEAIGCHFNLLSEEPARDLSFAQQFRALGTFIQQVVDQRRHEPPASMDLLDLLMEARDPRTGQFMSGAQLINEVLTLIVAGHETTASSLNWMWYLISQHPEVECKLSQELDKLTNDPNPEELGNFPYSRQIIEEAMRLYPAGWLMTRKALREDRFGDYIVPAKTEIYIAPYFIHRHPGLWQDPERFNPDRFAKDSSRERHRLAFIPFSAGPRNCIGSSLARLEMQIHLLIIAKRLRLRYVASGPIEFEAGVNLRSKHGFLMNPEIRA